jgi:hypothetical protein
MFYENMVTNIRDRIIATSWTDIDWLRARNKLLELQYEILKAYREKDIVKIRRMKNS